MYFAKMGKKRQNEESLESKAPAKKETPAEFNGTVFKTMLKDPTKAMKGELHTVTSHTHTPCSPAAETQSSSQR